MLKQRLTHPEILEALAAAGHGSRVLLADGNFPASTTLGENSALVYLNLAPGKPRVTEVLDVILSAIAVEEAVVMDPEDGTEPAVFEEFHRMLPAVELQKLDRMEFYEEVASPETCLVVVTGEQRLYANVLLTMGAVPPEL